MPPQPRRPRLHFTANRGWINDPLGLTYHNGEYHLFFQHLPEQVSWGPDCHWGHATSPDLLTWSERPIALPPGDGDGGCWSGSLVVPPRGEPALFYTSVTLPDFDVGTVRRAQPLDDNWEQWTKTDVVATLPAEVDAVTFRDPFVFPDAEQWRMIVGAGLRDGTATALGFVSDDLGSWKYTGPLARRSMHQMAPVWTGSLWECPQLFPLGDRHVLVVSVWDAHRTHYTAYSIGDYRDGTFTPDTWRRLTYGPSPYAAAWFNDASGRPSLISWLRGIDDPEDKWAGALSLPVVLTPDADRIVATPHPALTRRRVDASTPEHDQAGLDIEWTPERSTASLALTRERIDVAAQLHVDGGRLDVSAGDAPAAESWNLPYDGGQIRVVQDGPVLEIFTRAGMMALPIPTPGPLRPATNEPPSLLHWWRLK